MFETNQKFQPFNVYPHPNVSNPVLTPEHVDDDENVTGVADPFIVLDEENTFHMFFETIGEKGMNIGHAESEKGLNWIYDRIILNESVEMSYPQVFRWDDVWYLLPSLPPQHKEIRIYTASSFPSTWQLKSTISLDTKVLDPTIMRWGDRWYILYSDNFTPNILSRLRFPISNWKRPHESFSGGDHDSNFLNIISHFVSLERPVSNIQLISSDQLTGEWSNHPRSPVRKSLRTERNAGRIIKFEDTILVPFQDWENRGGEKVRVFQITDLSPTTYSDTEISESPLIQASGEEAWNRDGMHHIDLSCVGTEHDIVAVDGICQEEDSKLRSIGIYKYKRKLGFNSKTSN